MIPKKVIYNFYSHDRFIEQRTYILKDADDYRRVMELTEREPEKYEVVNWEY